MALTVQSILDKVAADLGFSILNDETPVSEAQGLAYLNMANLDIVRNLCPVRIKGNLYSKGRMDKLHALTELETVTENPCPSNTDPNFINGPSTNVPICFTILTLSTGGGSSYPMLEVSYSQCYENRGGTSYPATADKPMFSWGLPGGVAVVPNNSGGAMAVNYFFVEKPTDLIISDNWFLDYSLAEPAIGLTSALAWGQVEGELADAKIENHINNYISHIAQLLGEFGLQPQDLGG